MGGAKASSSGPNELNRRLLPDLDPQPREASAPMQSVPSRADTQNTSNHGSPRRANGKACAGQTKDSGSQTRAEI